MAAVKSRTSSLYDFFNAFGATDATTVRTFLSGISINAVHMLELSHAADGLTVIAQSRTAGIYGLLQSLPYSVNKVGNFLF